MGYGWMSYGKAADRLGVEPWRVDDLVKVGALTGRIVECHGLLHQRPRREVEITSVDELRKVLQLAGYFEARGRLASAIKILGGEP